MRHRVAGRHLGRETSHRLSLYRNLVTDLLRYERITTTEAKAKEIRPMAERIITLGRKGDLHSRRQALKFVYDPKVVKKVFDVIGPRMATRPGGYLRITGLEPRKGDGARMATIELVDVVDAPPTPRPQRVTAAPSARAAAAPVVEAPKVEEAAEAVEETAAEAAEAATAEVVAEETTAEAEPDAGTATGEPAAESDEDKGAEA
ncbi:MAG: 50S ribosomal protein L17 [Chloroflexi bacterium]|nr:50S ribosomal protein L17 [Chloroflexota bacterium]PWB44450.1 MAG: 50S ribosomal protein L17 [Dehalococcoidia bacterium]